MPSNLSFLDTNFPSFTSEDPVEKKVDVIENYLFMTVESLRYALSHLNAGNMEKNFVDSILTGNGALSEIKQTVSDHSASIELLTQVTTDQGENIAAISETVDAQGVAITSIASVTTEHTQSIASIIQQATADEAKIALVVDNNGVRAGAIIEAINGQSQALIDADKIQMTGTTTFLTPHDVGASGTTVINGGRIDTGTITLNKLATKNDSIQFVKGIGASEQVIGHIGYETGMGQAGTMLIPTDGIALKYDANHYLIVTSAGVRMQSGNNAIWVTDGGTSIGQAVFG